MRCVIVIGLSVLSASIVDAEPLWDTWPPQDYLVRSLVESVPKLLDEFHPDTGRFGTEPWICSDQNRIFRQRGRYCQLYGVSSVGLNNASFFLKPFLQI